MTVHLKGKIFALRLDSDTARMLHSWCAVRQPMLAVALPWSRHLMPQRLRLLSTKKRIITHLSSSRSHHLVRCYSVNAFVVVDDDKKRIIIHLSSSRSHHLVRCYSANAFVVVDDDKYGNKQVVSLTPRLYDYILSNVREPQVLRELREVTATMRGSQMQVSPDQAQLLAMLVQILGARRCIEVGVYTGYSSLAIALVLPESGTLVACERDGKALEVAKRFYEQAGVLHKVHIKHGLAIDSLNSLLSNGEAGSYDFAFIDAEKKMYMEYFEVLLKLIRVGGVIVVDNVLWHGKVADPLVNDSKTVSLRNFNKAILEDERVSISLVPIGDGMTICRKR